jgi:membrane-bound ClpP family serine protease
METWFWGFLVFGILCAMVTLILGGIMDHGFHTAFGEHLHFLQPSVIISGITVLGGSGVVMSRYTDWSGLTVTSLSILIAVIFSLLLYFTVIRTMENAESSLSFSIHNVVGLLGEVSIPIPAQGYGEVLLSMSGGLSNQIAASSEGTAIPSGSRVVIVSVKEGILFVVPFETKDDQIDP